MRRRSFLAGSAALLSAAALPVSSAGEDAIPEYEKPLFNLPAAVKTPVRIQSIDLLRNGNVYLLRSRSSDGVEGIVRTKQVEDFVPILLRQVIPHFIGKDARDLETLIDYVYIRNYKLAGQALWAPAAYVEQSLFDLLGRTVKKPVGELLGGIVRKEIPVYLSGSGRETTAEEEVDVYVRGVELTGARAVKFKIGGRMSRNKDTYPGRTETMMNLARKRLGGNVIIYADANGSYNAAKGIEVGRMLEDLDVAFFEEPCPWEEVSETKRVKDALTIPIAFGEQNSSLWGFQWMIDTKVFDIVQPDLNYNGGFIRTARVARMARKAGMKIVPHNTQTGASAGNILHFASAIPNIGDYMEYPWREPHKDEDWYTPQFPIQNGRVRVPTGPGLGIDFDPAFVAKATRVQVS